MTSSLWRSQSSYTRGPSLGLSVVSKSTFGPIYGTQLLRSWLPCRKNTQRLNATRRETMSLPRNCPTLPSPGLQQPNDPLTQRPLSQDTRHSLLISLVVADITTFDMPIGAGASESASRSCLMNPGDCMISLRKPLIVTVAFILCG